MYCKSANFFSFMLLISLFLHACTSAQASSVSITVVPTRVSTVVVVSTDTPTVTPLPILTNTPEAKCSSTNGTMENKAIYTDWIDKPMRYIVYLPPCYFFDENKRYPVLYMMHGQGFSEDQWIRIGAAVAADQLITAGSVPPFIMVFPFDYSIKPPTQYKFEDVIIYKLVPTIDQDYRTIADAEHRAIGGLSRGGAWAFHIGAKHPELFGAIGGHSPVVFYADDKSLQRNLLALPAGRTPRIWLDSGNNDSDYLLILSLEDFLSKNNIVHEWHSYVGWHDEKYWSAHVTEYLSWYAQAWK